MRFVTYTQDGGDRVGVLAGDQVHALPEGLTLLDLLRDGSLRDAGDHALSSPTVVLPWADIRLRAPIPDPPTVRDFMTFERHVQGVALLMHKGVQGRRVGLSMLLNQFNRKGIIRCRCGQRGGQHGGCSQGRNGHRANRRCRHGKQ